MSFLQSIAVDYALTTNQLSRRIGNQIKLTEPRGCLLQSFAQLFRLPLDECSMSLDVLDDLLLDQLVVPCLLDLVSEFEGMQREETHVIADGVQVALHVSLTLLEEIDDL